MDMGLVNVGTKDKGVFALGEPLGKFYTEPVGFLRGNFPRAERLADMVGDYIICGGQEGTVRSIGLVYTTLTTLDNKQVVFPNGSLSNTNLVNVTAQEKRCLELKVGIGYGSDLRKAKEIMEKLYVNHPLILKDQPVTVFVDDLADSAVVIGARGWVATGDYWKVKWDLTEQVKLEYDAAGIEIPFQQLDVNVKH